MFKEFSDDEGRSDDFLNEFRQKISDQNIESLEEKKEQMKRSKSIFLGVTGGVLMATLVGWFILAPQYRVESEKEIPVIRRPQTAIRVQPNEPGGMEIPNQDKSVYNIIEKKDDSSVENLLPPPEEPKLPVIVAQDEAPAPVNSPEKNTSLAEAQKIVEQNTPTVATTEDIIKKAEESLPVAQPAPVEEKVQPESKPAPQPIQESPKAKPADTKVVIKEEAKPAPEPKTVKAAVSGDWQIQLMSSPNRPAIVKAQGEVAKKYKLAHLPFEIESAVLDKNQTFYRLKVGAYKTRAEADKQCNDIKALGGTCIVKKK